MTAHGAKPGGPSARGGSPIRRPPRRGCARAGLPPLAALEFQYLLQVRTDQRRSKVILSAWTRAIITVVNEGVASVRDRDVEYWRRLSPNHATVPQLFTSLAEALSDL